MAKIIDVDFRKGSIANQGTLNVTPILTGATLVKGEKGTVFRATNVSSNTVQINTPLSGTYTVEFAVKVLSVGGGSGYFQDYRYNSGTGYIYSSSYAGLDASSGTKYINGTPTNVLAPYGVWMHIVVSGISLTASRIQFNSNSSSGQGVVGDYLFYRVYEGTLSAQEVAKLYADYQSSQPISKPKRGFIYPKPTDLKSQVNKTVENINVATISAATWQATNWSIGTGSASITAGSGDLYTQAPLMLGSRTYSYDITVSISSGTLTIIDFNGTSLATLTTGRNVGTFTNSSFTSTRFFYIRAATATATVSSVNVSLLSGLVAAYNMQPTGNVVTDISGNGYNFTVNGNTTGASINQDALKLPGTAGLTRTQLAQITQAGSYTVNGRVKINSIGLGIIWASGNSSADRNGLVITGAGALSFEKYNGTAYSGKSGSGFAANVWYNFSCVNTAGTHTFYVNGVEQTSTSTAGELGNSAALFNVAIDLANGTGSRNANIDIADLKVYNRAITLQEVKDYHNSFAKQVYISEDFSDQPADGNAVVPTGWTKVSGAWKIGEVVVKDSQLIYGFSLSGITGMTATGYTHAYVGGSGTKNIAVYGVDLSAFGGTAGGNYVATFDVTINSGTFPDTTFNNSVGGRAQNITAGSNTFNIYGVNGTNGYYFTINSSVDVNYTISNFKLVQVQSLPTIVKGTKYLECVTAGIIAIPSKQAYGTWEFDLLKGADSNNHEVGIIKGDLTARVSGTTNSYWFSPASTEGIFLLEDYSTTLLSSAAAYITNFTWYRVKITRSTAGVFTVLMKGGTLAATAGYDGWNLVTASSGSNPVTDTTYTTSNYVVLDLDAGDRITNIKLTNGVIIN